MKYFNLIIVLVFLMAVNMKSQDVVSREQIPDKYKWNLADLYGSKMDFDNDFEQVRVLADQFTIYKGTITQDAERLLNATKALNELWRRFYRLSMYASLQADADVSNGVNQALNDKVRKLGSDIAAKVAFYNPELLSVDQSTTLEKFISQKKELEEYRVYFDNIFRMKPHTLTPEGEEIMAQMGAVEDIPTKIYGILNDVELDMPWVPDESGSGDMVRVSHGRYRSALYSINRSYRKGVYCGIYEGYKKNLQSFAAIFNGRVLERVTNAKIRKYPSALDMATFESDVPSSVYRNLVKVVQDNVKTLHRWADIKKKALGLNLLEPFDTYVTLFPETPKEYSYDEAVKLVRAALQPLGKEYIKAYDSAIANRWIDVYETKNKRSGAYSNGCGCGVHPWVLLNWTGSLDDVFTFAHEMGHNMHSYFTEKTQPFQYTNYTTFVAEVASTMNEALLLDYMSKNAKTKAEKLSLLEKFMTNAQATFFRQTRFAEFEMMIHDKAERGEYLSAEELTKLFGDRYTFYWGPSMDANTVNTFEGLSWARIPHLVNYDFYVYQYATSFAASNALAEGIIKSGQPAIDKYLAFLRSGCSADPITLLKNAGVDMGTSTPIDATIKKMERYMDEIEAGMNR